MRISDWSSDVCSSDLDAALLEPCPTGAAFVEGVDAVQFVDREGCRATLLHPRQDGHLRRSHRLGEGVPVGFDRLGIVWKGGGQILEEIGSASCRERVWR